MWRDLEAWQEERDPFFFLVLILVDKGEERSVGVGARGYLCMEVRKDVCFDGGKVGDGWSDGRYMWW